MIIKPTKISNYEDKRWSLISTSEGFRKSAYACKEGIPTIGVGYALLTKQGGIWEIRSSINEDLQTLGITINKSDVDVLNKIADALNNGNQSSARSIINSSELSFSLSETQGRQLFDNIITEYEDIVRNKIGESLYNQLADSQEMIALLSLAYNNPSLIGEKLIEALEEGNRAEAWYEIRYNSNANEDRGLANRRYRESDLFGLYNDENMPTPEEIEQVASVYKNHRNKIQQYESRYKYKGMYRDNFILCRSSIDQILKNFRTASLAGNSNISSPILLDLDGDGIETTLAGEDAYFDHDHNGFAEQTGWVGPHDGILVFDRNGDGIINNGNELFGNNTILSNNATAEQGFIALADLDINHDGKIDAGDTAFPLLKIWIDSDVDGYSSAHEIYTLRELGIASISTGSTNSSFIDNYGNEHRQIGSFTKSDNSTGIATDVWFKTNKAYSIAQEWLDVPDDIASLPDLQGFGNVYDLHQAMVRDASGQLKSLVVQFTAEGNPEIRSNLINQIIFKWTGNEGLDPSIRGVDPVTGEITIDARKMAALESYMGEGFIGQAGDLVNILASVPLNHAYRLISEMFYGQLMVQTHLKNLFDKINYIWDEATDSLRGDLNVVSTDLQNLIASDPAAGKSILTEFVRTLKGLNATDMVNFNEFQSTLTAGNREVALIFNTAGLNSISGTSGNDTMHIRGASDVVDGGSGNDLLHGYGGNIVYLYNKGSGNDSIENWDNQSLDEGHYKIWFGDGLTPNAFDYSRMVTNHYDSLVMSIKETGETLILDDWFKSDGKTKETKLMFADGTVRDAIDVFTEIPLSGTDGNDILYGFILNDTMYGKGGDDTIFPNEGNDTAYGGGGNDYISGGPGNDILDGGPGNDFLAGNAGSDTYLFGRGSGQDVVNDYDDNDWKYLNASDKVVFGADITLSDLSFRINGYDLQIEIKGTSDSLTLQYWFYNDYYKVEQFQFADGSFITPADFNQFSYVMDGTPGNDTLYGSNMNDTMNGDTGDDSIYAQAGNDIINGGPGNDMIYGMAGDDILDGGAGNDILRGAEGSDIYVFSRGSGSDTIDDYWYSGNDYINGIMDSVSFGNGITLNDLEFWRTDGYDLKIKIKSTEDSLTISHWFTADYWRVDQFKFTDNSLVTSSDIDHFDCFIDGTQGNDTLYGSTMNDTINGGPGIDTMIGGKGNDCYIVDTAGDVVTEYENEGIDTVKSSITYTLGANVENLTVTGANMLNGTGNILDNKLIGNSAANVLTGKEGNDILDGGAGKDTLIGGVGNDTYIIDNTGDIVTEMANEGVDNVQSSVTYTLANNVENLTLTGSAAINGTGNTLDNKLIGNGAVNTLTGGAGNDYLDGGSGIDKLIGGTGNDTYIIDNTKDTITEKVNEGTDTVQSSVTYTLASYVENLTLVGTDLLSGTGNTMDNTIIGNSAANTLNGAAGNDTLLGNGGNDTIKGGTGDDLIIGGTGNDTLYGEGDNDTYRFAKGDGNDIINDAGADTSYQDKVIFNVDVLRESIALFKSGTDLIVGYGDGDIITVKNQTSSSYGIEKMQLDSGLYVTDADINKIIQDMTAFSANHGITIASISDVKKNQDLMTIVYNGWHS